MPVKWHAQTLAEIAEGGMFVDGDWVESRDQDPNGDVRLTQLADVGVAAFRDRSDRWMRRDQAESLSCTYLRPGDLMIARMPEPLGRTCLVPDTIGRAVTAVDVAVLRLARDDLEPKFVMWALNSPQVREQMVRLQTGTTRKRISRKNLARVRVPVPPRDEQRRIVEILEDHLSRLDAGTAALERSVARLDACVLSQLSATRARLAAIHPSRSIGEFCETTLGKMLDAKRQTGSLTPYLRNVNVRWGEFDMSDVKATPMTDVDRARLGVAVGDVMVCEGGEPGRCAVWQEGDRVIAFQKALHRVRVRDHEAINAHYVQMMLMEGAKTGRYHRLFTGTTIKHLPQERLRLIGLPLAPRGEQDRVVSQVDATRMAAERLRHQVNVGRRRASLMRLSLLQAAFSDRLTGDFAEATRSIEEARSFGV